MIMKEVIANLRGFDFLNKFSLSAPKEKYREQ